MITPGNSRGERLVVGVSTAVLALVGILTLWLAVVMDVDAFDPMDYLTNSRILWNGGNEGLSFEYVSGRPPLPAFVYAPLQVLQDSPRLHWQAVHVLSWALSMASLYLIYRFLRLRHGASLGLGCVALFSVSPLFLNYAATCHADVQSMLLVVAFLLAWLSPLAGGAGVADLPPSSCGETPPEPAAGTAALQGAGKAGGWRRPVIVGALMGLAVCSKYPLLLLPGIYLLVELLAVTPVAVSGGPDWKLTRLFKRLIQPDIVITLFSAWAVFHVVHAVLFLRIWDHASFLYANAHVYIQIFQTFVKHAKTTDLMDVALSYLGRQPTHEMNPIWEYGHEMLFCFPMVAVALAVVGAIVLLRRRERGDLAVILAPVLFGGILTVLIKYKEFRYLFPLMPCFLMCCAEGTQTAVGWLRSRTAQRGKNAAVLAVVGLVALLAQAGGAAVQTARQRMDPIHTVSTLVPFCESLRSDLLGNEEIYWDTKRVRSADSEPRHSNLLRPSNLLTLYPEHRFELPYCEFWAAHSVSARDIEYFTGRQVKALFRVADDKSVGGLKTIRETRQTLVTGRSNEIEEMDDAELFVRAFSAGGVVLRPTGEYYWSPELSKLAKYPPAPLEVTRVWRRTLTLGNDAASDSSASYSSSTGERVELRLRDGRWRMDGESIAPEWVVFAVSPDGTLARLEAGGGIAWRPEKLELTDLQRTLLSYDAPPVRNGLVAPAR